ncbi:MAG: diacylglycerol kinase family lipid kinase [Gemmatimonadaceae bacterium]|nr:diacylglycerol kinase family lipid kinase [Gemmatimonadaceae bacterium]
MSSTIPVVINAGAGNSHASDRAKALTELFLAGGMQVDVRLAESGADIDRLVREAVAKRPRVFVAAGGDGTISTAAAALAGTDIVLGVLPFGTLNHFAKDLKIPLELEASVQNIVENNVIAVDVGEVNGKIFINNSSLGMYPDIVRDRERQQTRLGRGKWNSLVWASLAALRRFPFLTVRIEVEGEKRGYVTPLVFIGNNEYQMTGFDIGARESLEGGALSVYIVKKSGRAALVRLSMQAVLGRLEQARDFEAMKTPELVIETRRSRVLVATDGEVQSMTSPLRYRVRPRSLRVIVPRVVG